MRAEAIVGVVIVLVTLSIGSILWLSSGSDEVASLGVDKSTFETKESGPAGLAGDAAEIVGGFGNSDRRGGRDRAPAEPAKPAFRLQLQIYVKREKSLQSNGY